VPAELVARMDNAPKDRHVLAAAVSGAAQAIVTANNRRGVSTIGDVLAMLDRNKALKPFVELARSRLL
jgi:hypothetical protein